MRGRTNIPPRVGGIVNGRVTECVVANGNTIDVGDYVQLALKEGAKPRMLKDTQAINSIKALANWLEYGVKTFKLSDGNIINISQYDAKTVATQIVIIDSTGATDSIRVTMTAFPSTSSNKGYGLFSVCRIYEDCFLVINSSYYDGAGHCNACLIKYNPATKTAAGTVLSTPGTTDPNFLGFKYYADGFSSYAYTAMGVVSNRIIRFVSDNQNASPYVYEVFVDEANAALSCNQLTLDYGTTGATRSDLIKTLQSMEEFTDGYFGLLFTSGAYCRLVGNTVTLLQCSTAALGTKIEQGVYAFGEDAFIELNGEQTISHTLPDLVTLAGVKLSTIGNTYVGTSSYDVVFKADAVRKQLELQDTWENKYYNGGGTGYSKKFRYFKILFVKLSSGVVLGVAPVPQIAFNYGSNYSGVSQQQLLTGCYCGVFSFDEQSKAFKNSRLEFDTFIPFEEPVLIYTTSRGDREEYCTMCGVETAFISNNVAKVGLWFTSNDGYSGGTFRQHFMPFTIKIENGKVVNLSSKNIVEKYEHHVFGIAKTSGSNGDLIDIYMPE